MNRLYFGKISKLYPQQFDRNFYAAGKEGNPWYGGIKVGDFVFPISNRGVSKLWRVKRFNTAPNEINPDGCVEFEVVKEFREVPISNVFSRYRHFILDINLVNKLTKSTKGSGFFAINAESDCPEPEKIDFTESRNIYVATESPFQPPAYKEGDIRVLINDTTNFSITSIDVYRKGKFEQYAPLFNLYTERNKVKYNLNELLNYALQDNAENKKEYLKSVMEELKKVGFFLAGSPIGLYDNILVGRKVSKSKKSVGSVEEELPEEEEDEIEEIAEEYKEFVDLLDSNPNLILYGPPGTGKTYSAIKIIEAFDHFRTQNGKSFSEIKNEGRVDFVTFHQSFSYEEFVEGLRPTIKSDSKEDSEAEENSLQYKIQDGILKQIANKAALSQIKSEIKGDAFQNVDEDNTIWKLSLGRKGIDEDIYNECINSNEVAIGFLKDDLTGWSSEKIYEGLKSESNWKSENPRNDAKSIDYFINQMQIGDVVLVFASISSIRAIGVVTGEYKFNKKPESYRHRRNVKWLREFKEPVNILKYNDGVRLTLQTLYPLTRFKFSDIKEILEIGQEGIKQTSSVVETPFYLIIDEINRGNISKIFGELITLIEKDKRNSIHIKLPSSQKNFSLPSNLYIIGTMNTSDRSIAVLDVALRRRFYFKEIEPDSRIILQENPAILQHVDLVGLFEKLNAKLTYKLDRDHRIGHSHFLNIHTVSNLKMVWYYQVIPLLMEYFYNDANSIAEIIGDAFIDKTTSQIRWINNEEEFKKAIISIP